MNLINVLAASSSSDANGLQGVLSWVVIYVVIIGVFWFFAIRPQSKKQKEHDSLLTTLEVGDSILTTSGFFGVVIDIMDEVVIVEFGNNKNCRIPMKKENIVEIDKQGNEK
jgi:preprotein translocase subunit YajC